MIDSNRLSLEEYYFLHEHGEKPALKLKEITDLLTVQ